MSSVVVARLTGRPLIERGEVGEAALEALNRIDLQRKWFCLPPKRRRDATADQA
jgi:hypothetical protein